MTIYLQVYMRYTRYMRATFQLVVATFVSSSGKLRCFKIMHAYKYKRRAGGQDVALINWSRKVVGANCMACPQQQYENARWRKAAIGDISCWLEDPESKREVYLQQFEGREVKNWA